MDPVGVRVLQRPLGEGVEQISEPGVEPPHHGVREGDRPLEARCADELDGLVHDRVRRHAVQVGELVGAEPERRPDRRVELADGPAAERVDPVVERADALDRSVGDPLGERAVARVELLRRARERTVGVRIVFEDAEDDLVGGPARRRDAHCTRSRHRHRHRQTAPPLPDELRRAYAHRTPRRNAS